MALATDQRRLQIPGSVSPAPADGNQVVAAGRAVADRAFPPIQQARITQMPCIRWVLVANIAVRNAHGLYPAVGKRTRPGGHVGSPELGQQAGIIPRTRVIGKSPAAALVDSSSRLG